jgi:hypothetical protein
MKAPEYKKLCKRIHREYGKKLGMSYFHSCEVCDAVYFGEMSVTELDAAMTAAVEES